MLDILGACLLSLAVAYGDTGKLLSATSAMLMSLRSSEKIIMPAILVSGQKFLRQGKLSINYFLDFPLRQVFNVL